MLRSTAITSNTPGQSTGIKKHFQELVRLPEAIVKQHIDPGQRQLGVLDGQRRRLSGVAVLLGAGHSNGQVGDPPSRLRPPARRSASTGREEKAAQQSRDSLARSCPPSQAASTFPCPSLGGGSASASANRFSVLPQPPMSAAVSCAAGYEGLRSPLGLAAGAPAQDCVSLRSTGAEAVAQSAGWYLLGVAVLASQWRNLGRDPFVDFDLWRPYESATSNSICREPPCSDLASSGLWLPLWNQSISCLAFLFFYSLLFSPALLYFLGKTCLDFKADCEAKPWPKFNVNM
ncbi:transcription factor btd-like [Rhineura floridana]|uniref:transcription factor btd-like n=1 Tax=Rhineura floridana TaxID=261503 RepID=UPI002AC88699|nr:transcription factor btd-like [Rhineura floridana]